MLEDFHAYRVHQKGRQAQQKFGFGNVLDENLMCHMDDRAGSRIGLIAAVDVPVEKDLFPRHENIVEDDDGIHLLESGTERMIIMRSPVIHALAAEEAQAGGVVRDDEAEGVGGVFLRALQQGRGKDHDLVGNRQRGQHTASADHDAGVRLFLHSGGEERIGLLC